mmetsp:Transcript_36815/g.95315  ORF Transcript_36815/g.95315 Transcript_36815/m.95315 type:complete len:207 (-) Transcript_36815:951-1571(-)
MIFFDITCGISSSSTSNTLYLNFSLTISPAEVILSFDDWWLRSFMLFACCNTSLNDRVELEGDLDMVPFPLEPVIGGAGPLLPPPRVPLLALAFSNDDRLARPTVPKYFSDCICEAADNRRGLSSIPAGVRTIDILRSLSTSPFAPTLLASSLPPLSLFSSSFGRVTERTSLWLATECAASLSRKPLLGSCPTLSVSFPPPLSPPL